MLLKNNTFSKCHGISGRKVHRCGLVDRKGQPDLRERTIPLWKQSICPLYTPFRSVLNKRHWRLEPPHTILNGHMRLRSQGTYEQQQIWRTGRGIK